MGTVKLRLDEYIDSLEIKRYELSKRTGINFETVDRYYKNKVVRYDSYILAKFCDALKCDISDIIEFISDEDLEKEKDDENGKS